MDRKQLIALIDQERGEIARSEDMIRGMKWHLELIVEKGETWTTEELRRDYIVVGFCAPYVEVIRRRDNVRGALEFRHSPRFYFDFQPEHTSEPIPTA